MVKLKDLCKGISYRRNENSALDNVAISIFHPDSKDVYIQTTQAVQRRYSIPVDKQYCHVNRDISEFELLGPTEQFIINKILDTPSPILYIIGGIGVGKSSFLHFFVDTIVPKIDKAGQTTSRTHVVFYDFLQELYGTTYKTQSELLLQAFQETICDKLAAELRAFFDLEMEVTDIWEDILSSREKNPYQESIVARIRIALSNSDALLTDLQASYNSVLKKRKKIRQEIVADRNRRITYLAVLCNYAVNRYLDGNSSKFMIIIDNVDREPTRLQQEVKVLLKTFARLSKVRIVIPSRQSTYNQRFADDLMSEITDKVPFCGVDHMDVITNRLELFLRNPEQYTPHFDSGIRDCLIKSIKYINENIVNHKLFLSAIGKLAGHSIRKSLVLAQYLIDNSVYDLIEVGSRDSQEKELHITNILSALYRNDEHIFNYDERSIVENIFQVQALPGQSFLIKLRLLRLLLNCNDRGTEIQCILDALTGFDYGTDLIRHAINELKHYRKRLIWSDSVRNYFDNEENLFNNSHSKLFLTSGGIGYADYLFFDMNYIQEVMLDTFVNPIDFDSSYYYGSIFDRVSLLFDFANAIFDQELKELERFFSKGLFNDYHAYFGDSTLYSNLIFKNIRHSSEKVINSYINNIAKPSKGKFLKRQDRLREKYDERINFIDYTESELFRFS